MKSPSPHAGSQNRFKVAAAAVKKFLTARAIAALIKKLFTVGLLLFLPAWSLHFWEAWVFLLIFSISQLLTTIYLLRNDPALLERRLKGGPSAESRPKQKVLMSFVSLCVVLLLVVPGLDHRLYWSHVPVWLVVGADIAILLGFFIQFLAFKENTFASATIALIPRQKVISTGPYAVVRHPMYSGGLLVNMFAPIALGSWWGLPLSVAWLVAIVLRILDEEKLLRESLPGYEGYCQQVQYRLIPHVS